jgi:hypothetical protein
MLEAPFASLLYLLWSSFRFPKTNIIECGI